MNREDRYFGGTYAYVAILEEKYLQPSKVLRVLFPNKKVLHCLMYENLILSKHAIIRIHPEDLLTKFCVYPWEFVIL